LMSLWFHIEWIFCLSFQLLFFQCRRVIGHHVAWNDRQNIIWSFEWVWCGTYQNFSKTSPSTSKQYPKSRVLSLGQVRNFMLWESRKGMGYTLFE
jgi:hypothetical protein